MRTGLFSLLANEKRHKFKRDDPVFMELKKEVVEIKLYRALKEKFIIPFLEGVFKIVTEKTSANRKHPQT